MFVPESMHFYVSLETYLAKSWNDWIAEGRDPWIFMELLLGRLIPKIRVFKKHVSYMGFSNWSWFDFCLADFIFLH